MTNKQLTQYWTNQLKCGELFKTRPAPLSILERENECKAVIIKRMGAIGRNLGLKAAQGYAVSNGLSKAHARVAMQLNAALKGGF